MPEITIDTDICRKDGLYTMACTRDIFHQEERNISKKHDISEST